VFDNTNKYVAEDRQYTSNLQAGMELKVIKAAAIFLQREDGLVLGVSRKYDPNDFGLPGGKLDEGETFEDAAIRECFEETGLTISELTPIFRRMDGEMEVVTFVPKRYQGTLQSQEKGVVKWVTEEDLVKGSFGEYNKELLKKVKELNGY